MRALVIEDDVSMAHMIERLLRRSGHIVYSTYLGEEGIDLSKVYDYDIIILDMNLPDMSGPDVLRKLRAARVATPVLILSGLGDADSKIASLELGASDYVTKPFNQHELLARFNAIVRRANGHAASLIQIGSLTVDLDGRLAEVDGRRVPLTAKEFAILELLALHKGKAVTREKVLDHLYGDDDDAPEPKVIDVFLHKIRKKLTDATGYHNLIRTSWGRGYTLQEPGTTDH